MIQEDINYISQVRKRRSQIKKKTVYKGELKQICITVYSIELKATKVDFQLRKLSAEERFYIKYVSFKNNNINKKVQV